MSRSLNDLNPVVRSLAEQHTTSCKSNGIDVMIIQTYRSDEEQDALYAQGRTAPGKIVTNAKGGDSMHNYKLAYDMVVLIEGKINWSDRSLYERIGELGEALDLTWGGRFKSLADLDHFQYTFGLSLADLKAGKIPPNTLET